MIVKNEEEVLGQCLESVKRICDEIIIVDTGSTDQTKKIAQQYTDKIFDFPWQDDFAKARNFAFEKATQEYILWLDADDVLLEKDQEKLMEVKKNLDSSVDAVSMYYHISFDAQNNPTFLYRRNRLVRRDRQFQWIGVVHEYLEVYGNLLHSDIAVTHRKSNKSTSDSSRNLRIYENLIASGKELNARDLFYYSNELKDHLLFEKAILHYEKFLESNQGWIEDEIRACLYLASCYKATENTEMELSSLFRTFYYDIPRAEALCLIGDYYKERENWYKAIFWYSLATYSEENNQFGFFQPKYATWYPHLQLCVCYWKQGNMEQSMKHNNLAKQSDPNNELVKNNEAFFLSVNHSHLDN